MDKLRTLNVSRVRARVRIPNLFYAHPFELTLGFVLVLSGIRALLTSDTSPTVDASLSPLQLQAFQSVSGLSGVLIVGGLLIRVRRMGRTVERAGLWLAAGAYAGYAIILVASALPMAAVWINVTTSSALAIACLIRSRAIRKTELAILQALRDANAVEDTAADLIRKLVDSRADVERDRR